MFCSLLTMQIYTVLCSHDCIWMKYQRGSLGNSKNIQCNQSCFSLIDILNLGCTCQESRKIITWTPGSSHEDSKAFNSFDSSVIELNNGYFIRVTMLIGALGSVSCDHRKSAIMMSLDVHKCMNRRWLAFSGWACSCTASEHSKFIPSMEILSTLNHVFSSIILNVM